MKKVLFIQHATAFGGSAMSLLYTLQGIRKAEGESYKLVVALAKWTNVLDNFYSSYGFEVVQTEWIDTYEHTQAVSYSLFNPIGLFKEIKQNLNLLKARRNTRKLIEEVNPDIVHLNSIVLLGSAIEISQMGIPLVWHIREPSVKGLLGFRRNRIINTLKDLTFNLIFICKADKISWGNPLNGDVVYNFIDFENFKPIIHKNNNLQINKNDNMFFVLFLGGVNKIKGTIIMLKAFNLFKKNNPYSIVKLIFAGGKYEKPNYFIYKIITKILPFFGLGTYSQNVERVIKKLNLEEDLIRVPFINNVAELFSISDVLVFPSIRPHFARPIIEAGAMSLPVIGSDLGGVSELVQNGQNGYLTKPRDYVEIANRLNDLLNDQKKCRILGENGYQKAIKSFNQKNNVLHILRIYKNISEIHVRK